MLQRKRPAHRDFHRAVIAERGYPRQCVERLPKAADVIEQESRESRDADDRAGGTAPPRSRRDRPGAVLTIRLPVVPEVAVKREPVMAHG